VACGPEPLEIHCVLYPRVEPKIEDRRGAVADAVNDIGLSPRKMPATVKLLPLSTRRFKVRVEIIRQ
jgi:hypothetical protein